MRVFANTSLYLLEEEQVWLRVLPTLAGLIFSPRPTPRVLHSEQSFRIM